MDSFNGHRPAVESDKIYTCECGNGLQAQVLVKDGAMGPFVDVGIGRQGHNENITHGSGLLKVANVANVEQVENTMTVDDALAFIPQTSQYL